MEYSLTQELKDKWVTALRSGKYPQGFEQLKSIQYTDGQGNPCKPFSIYCCLGVLAEITEYESKDTDYLRDTVGNFWYLDEEAQKLLGEMNDNQDKNFDEIAEFIETNIVIDEYGCGVLATS